MTENIERKKGKIYFTSSSRDQKINFFARSTIEKNAYSIGPSGRLSKGSPSDLYIENIKELRDSVGLIALSDDLSSDIGFEIAAAAFNGKKALILGMQWFSVSKMMKGVAALHDITVAFPGNVKEIESCIVEFLNNLNGDNNG